MPILIVSCLILQLNLDLIIHKILGMGFCFIFVKSLVVRLVLDNAFLDQELLIGRIIYHPHCLMSLDNLTFHDLYNYLFDV